MGLGDVFESLACGTPCVHGDYAGAAEHLPQSMKVVPGSWRLEGQFNCLRPVFDVEEWRSTAIIVGKERKQYDPPTTLPFEIDWNNLWSKWEAWFRQ